MLRSASQIAGRKEIHSEKNLPLNVKNGMKVLKNKTIYTGTGKIDNGYVRYQPENLRSGRNAELSYRRKTRMKSWKRMATYVIPGFVDVHSHGGYGKDSDGCFPG